MEAAFAAPQPLVARNVRRATCARTPICAIDSQAPPESRVAPYYSKESRFKAPYLNLHNVVGCELMNKIGMVMQEVPLDLEAAAALKGTLTRHTIASEEDFATLFESDITDDSATTVDEKYYPFARRFETPIIEITPPSNSEGENSGEVRISVGQVISTPPPDPVDERSGAFWKQPVAPAPSVDTLFPLSRRHLAPIIEFPPGTLAVSVKMGQITGEPDAPLYPEDTRFIAPVIKMKAPKGDWDNSAFVAIEMNELQLPILKTV